MDNRFEELHRLIEENHPNICGITAMRNGKSIYGDTWHGYAQSDAFNIMSVTKSVVSLLFGIAKDKGLIGELDGFVLDYFPDYTVRRGEKTIGKVTLRQLLTMTAPYKYKSEPWTKVCSSEDWTKAALDLLGGRAGITGDFKYSTLGIHILTGIIAKKSGFSTVDFANRFLFEPLGIPPHKNYCAETKEEHVEFVLTQKPRGKVWFSDPMDVNTAGWGLCLSACDMAKIGSMCLDNGRFGGKQIVSAEWISESTKPRIKCDERFANMSYCYLWWSIDEKTRTYAAIGDGGNVIYVNPEKNVTVGVSANFKPRIFDRIALIEEKILPLL